MIEMWSGRPALSEAVTAMDFALVDESFAKLLKRHQDYCETMQESSAFFNVVLVRSQNCGLR